MFFNKKRKSNKVVALEITDTNFNDLIMNSEQPILVDFWAAWCGPCKIIGPIIDELARDFEGRAIIGKVNVEANPNLSHHFKIKNIPTLMLINQGELKQRFSGMVPKPDLADMLDHYIAENELDAASEEE